MAQQLPSKHKALGSTEEGVHRERETERQTGAQRHCGYPECSTVPHPSALPSASIRVSSSHDARVGSPACTCLPPLRFGYCSLSSHTVTATCF